MKKYPFIGAPVVITAPSETVNAMTGIVLDPSTMGQAVAIVDGMTVQNTGAAGNNPGRVAVIFHNTDALVDLVVTPQVTAKMTVACGKQVSAVPKSVTIGAGEMAIIGPFSRALEDTLGKVTFAFTGDEGRCYAINVR
jgi:hypothetical protein